MGLVPNHLSYQFYTNTGDSHQANAPVGPPSNQVWVNGQSLYGQGTMGLVPNHLPYQFYTNTGGSHQANAPVGPPSD
jgi:hypothetical protein